jgi:hypothetical protein
MSVRDDAIAFVETHKGELMLDYFDVVRLIGFDEDDDDCYYKVQAVKRGVYSTSCIGWLIPLKGVLPKEDYSDLERVFNLNVGVETDQISEKTLDMVDKIDGEPVEHVKPVRFALSWDGFWARMSALWHRIRHPWHFMVWCTPAEELCRDDLICHTCNCIFWCRAQELSQEELKRRTEK